MPGETAVYDLVSFGHQTLNRKHFGVRSAAMISAKGLQGSMSAQQLYRPPPKITYNSAGSDSEEDDKIYESLQEVQLRKNREAKHRLAKTSKVKRTGHPLFDTLREEKALKENVKRPAKEVVNPRHFERQHSDYHNTIKNMKMYADPKMYKKNKQNSENYHQTFNPKYMSLQQLNLPENKKYHRRVSEHNTSQTLPKQLNVSKKALAKSAQNLMTLDPGYTHRQPMQHFQMMNPVSTKRNAHGRIPNSRNHQESSDSDSDWMVIPRPKISHVKIAKNRHSDDSDTSGHLIR